VVQEHRRLRTDGPVEVIGEVFGIGINGACERFALPGVSRFDDGLDGIKQFIDAGDVVMACGGHCSSSLMTRC
jgi:hypothetical protein